MAGFTYENNLPHQDKAIDAVLGVFDCAHVAPKERNQNPLILFSGSLKTDNLKAVQARGKIHDAPLSNSNVIDIAMETGTGKTYTYTKTMFELHRQLGIFKFIVLVPTLSIKAGTKSFLESQSLEKHFRDDFNGAYGNTKIELYVVESKKKQAKNKKSTQPESIVDFVNADNVNHIHVLLINMGMINSDTLAGKNQDGSQLINDEFNIPMEALASVKPFVILDEPHKFDTSGVTWKNIEQLQSQFILRYGATFPTETVFQTNAKGKKIKDENGKFIKIEKTLYENLVYRLSALDAFNDELVKGIRAFVEQIDDDKGERIQFKGLDNEQAIFALGEQDFHLSENDDLSQIHHAISDLSVIGVSKKHGTVLLSNGLELKRGDKINPYSYNDPVRDKMMRQAIKQHFQLEQQLLTRTDGGRIKPLTLFFIDDIQGYRDEQNQLSGSLKTTFEQMLKAELESCLKTETDPFLQQHWQTALQNISQTHGGYFSKDNSDKDEDIEQQINEILHDKQKLLDLNNPRRFIFSKWTLREGWDNPNVFQICKLRSSGSETSKLQEVGRGLRLPVNEHMARVKDQAFFLNYFVDSSEHDFVQKLTNEVNSSVSQATEFTQVSDELIRQIQATYPDETVKKIRAKLADYTDDNDVFVENGFAKVKELFPNAFTQRSLKDGKIKSADEKNKKVKMRVAHYQELKALWETINQKAILHYQIENEDEFLGLFTQFLRDSADKFKVSGIRTIVKEIRVDNHQLAVTSPDSVADSEIFFEPINTMNYREFLLKLSQVSLIKMPTLHQAFVAVCDKIQIDKFLSERTIYTIQSGFDRWLLLNSFNQFEVGYQTIGGAVHPTKLTDKHGNPLDEINASDLGTQFDSHKTPLKAFLFDSVFFDSELEQENITENQIKEVIVFTKIPKNSIKIPVAGGGSYSPDFAYIVKTAQGETLNLILESKNVADSQDLRLVENQKIKHAEKLFSEIAKQTKVVFETQFSQSKITDLIRKYIK